MALGPQLRQKPRPRFSASGHVFHTAWETMIKSYNHISSSQWFNNKLWHIHMSNPINTVGFSLVPVPLTDIPNKVQSKFQSNFPGVNELIDLQNTSHKFIHQVQESSMSHDEIPITRRQTRFSFLECCDRCCPYEIFCYGRQALISDFQIMACHILNVKPLSDEILGCS